MHQHLETLTFETPGAGLSDITRHVADALGRARLAQGAVTLLCSNIYSGSLVTQRYT